MRREALVALALAAGCAAPPQDIRSMITPEAIAASTEPLLFVELTETGQQAIMSLSGRNGDVVTWSTADGKSISLQQGVLVATRGFGFDLMSADVSGTLAALNGGAREYERFLSFLDGENRTVIRTYVCEMEGPFVEVVASFSRRVSVARWVETCMGLEGERRSEYARSGGEMWLTREPVSPRVGEMLTERLTGG